MCFQMKEMSYKHRNQTIIGEAKSNNNRNEKELEDHFLDWLLPLVAGLGTELNLRRVRTLASEDAERGWRVTVRRTLLLKAGSVELISHQSCINK